MRKTDESKIERVTDSFRRHPEGTYLSEIASEANLAKSTVSFILERHFSKKLEVVKEGKNFRIIRLKSGKI